MKKKIKHFSNPFAGLKCFINGNKVVVKKQANMVRTLDTIRNLNRKGLKSSGSTIK